LGAGGCARAAEDKAAISQSERGVTAELMDHRITLTARSLAVVLAIQAP
jgi:hypothetical protein